jgi:hypothetical protein
LASFEKPDRLETSDRSQMIDHDWMQIDQFISLCFVAGMSHEDGSSGQIEVFPPRGKWLADPPSGHVSEHQ